MAGRVGGLLSWLLKPSERGIRTMSNEPLRKQVAHTPYGDVRKNDAVIIEPDPRRPARYGQSRRGERVTVTKIDAQYIWVRHENGAITKWNHREIRRED